MQKEQTAQIAKWVGITLLGIAFLVLFRGEISSLLGRTSSVSVSSTGVTFETPLGKTDVTRQISAPSSYREIYPATYFDTYFMMQDGYAISRPVGSRLRTVDELGPDFEILRRADGFSFGLVAVSERDWDAMVTVRIYSSPGLEINVAVQGFFDAAGQGIQYEKPRIDQHTQSATLFGYDQQTGKQFVSRVYLRGGRLYDLRASFSRNISEDLKSQLNVVTNSFHLLNL